MAELFIAHKKTIKVDPYGYELHVVVTNDVRRAYSNSVPGKLPKAPKLNAGMVGFVWRRDGCIDIYMFLPTNVDLDTISHECFHVLWFIMTQCDIPCSEDGEEAWAYLNGFISNAVTSLVSKITS